MDSLDALSNHSLLESYHKAYELNLDPEFLQILEKELVKRDLIKQ